MLTERSNSSGSKDVLKVGRPAFGQAQQTIGMFVLTPDGSEAVRTSVKLGRNSVSTIEIIEGLKEGDQVIISDTSALDSYNRIRVAGDFLCANSVFSVSLW